jgi:dipeptidyl aminopeptidase/acylaminoacyl peptidase
MSRVGVFGWSYGGYMALMALAQRPDVFKVAISGAPVTTWALYDTAYTERYMGLPDEHKEAYEKGSVLNSAKNFPNE